MESILEAEEALMRFGCVVVVVISRCIEYKRIEQSEFLLLVGRQSWFESATVTAVGFGCSSGSDSGGVGS